MIRLLASVRNLSEARLALRAGVDILDVKEPRSGALGAVSPARLAPILRYCRSVPVSVTLGDPPYTPGRLLAAARRRAGVRYVKIGCRADDWSAPVAAALRSIINAGTPVVLVALAEGGLPLARLAQMRAIGVHGVMLDTLDKRRSLRAWFTLAELGRFVNACRGHGLLCGLAGSLSRRDILPLARLEPDVLGFRGALCRDGARAGKLCRERIEAVRAHISRAAPAA